MCGRGRGRGRVAGGEGVETRLLQSRWQQQQAHAHAAARRVAEAVYSSEVQRLEAGLHLSSEAAAALHRELEGATARAVELEGRVAEEQARSSVRDAEETYLRNVVKKYMETEQHEALFPVIATCMRFTQAEVDEILAGRERRISQGTLFLRRER